MKKTKSFVSVMLVALLVLAMASSAFAEGGLKIGFIGPLTGGAAVYGISAKQGAEIAVDEINALGGMQIDLNTQDDEHDAEKSVNAYNTLMDWGVQMINGCVTSTPCVAVAAEAMNDRVFMLTPSATSTSVTDGKDMMYQLCFTDPNQGITSAQYIGQNALATKVAVIYNNADAYSTGIYQGFDAEAKNQPFEIVSVTTFADDNNADFSVQLAAAKDAGADLVFLPIYYTPASNILKQADAMEFTPVFFGVDGMDGILTMEGFDTALAENVMLLSPFSADATDEKTVNFVTTYREKYNDTPTQFAADSYDVIYALYEAAKLAGIDESVPADEACDKLISAFTTMSFEGLTGAMKWSANGEVTKSPIVFKIMGGKYVAQ